MSSEKLKMEIVLIRQPSFGIGTSMALLVGVTSLTAWPALYLDWHWVKQETPAKEFWLSVGFTVWGLFWLWVATINYWRLLGSNNFDVQVWEDGLLLHPSLYSKTIEWSKIKRSRVRKTPGSDRSGYWRNRLELELTEPIRSLSFPFSTKTIVLSSSRIGSNPEMVELGRWIRHYRKAAGWKK